MKYFFLFLNPFLLFAQLDTISKFTDITSNTLILTPTGYTIPQGNLQFQIHEFIDYRFVYSPISRLQLNAGYLVKNNIVTGAKIQLY